MNWGLISIGFFFGTFKFLFSHWTVYLAFPSLGLETILEIFVSTTAGALISMTAFYFLSEYMMERAAEKRKMKRKAIIASGAIYIPQKKFTRLNKIMVRLKMGIGIYGITALAPLFLSIPLGAIVCAKFYGDHKKTYPLMLLFMTSYSVLMCSLIYLIH